MDDSGPAGFTLSLSHSASYRGDAHIISALLLAGADHTIADTSGETPYQVALARPGPQCAAIFKVREFYVKTYFTWMATQVRFNPGCVLPKKLSSAKASSCLLQWWKGELDRAYALHKARTLHEGTATRQQAPAAPLPAYLSPRVLGGSAIMPSVEVGTEAGKGKRSRGGQDGMTSYYGQVEVVEEEMAAMVGFVVKDLATELYTELRAGFC
jgi:hypothetical protein